MVSVYAVIGLTWVGWAAIGLLSGHMFLLVSRGGPIHFAGIPAVIFCGCVLAAAAALAVAIVDHYDRRDNEKHYKHIRKWMWWLAAALLVASIAAGCAGPDWRGDSVALMAPDRFARLLASDALAKLLGPLHDKLKFWSVMSLFAFMAFAVITNPSADRGKEMSTPVFLVMAFFIVLPGLLLFVLSLLADIVIGDAGKDMKGDLLGAHMAWIYSMMLACGAAALLFFLVLVAGLAQVVAGWWPGRRKH